MVDPECEISNNLSCQKVKGFKENLCSVTVLYGSKDDSSIMTDWQWWVITMIHWAFDKILYSQSRHDKAPGSVGDQINRVDLI